MSINVATGGHKSDPRLDRSNKHTQMTQERLNRAVAEAAAKKLSAEKKAAKAAKKAEGKEAEPKKTDKKKGFFGKRKSGD